MVEANAFAHWFQIYLSEIFFKQSLACDAALEITNVLLFTGTAVEPVIG